MRLNKTLALGLALTAPLLAVAMIAALALPAAAAPAQQDMLPTPTVYPVDAVDANYEVVGGEDVVLTFDMGEAEGFVFGETTVKSEYPRGMAFTIKPTSPNGEISDVTLYMIMPNDQRARFDAEWNPELEAWVARPWELGDGAIAWVQFDFYWRVRDETGVFVDSAPQKAEYWDPTRQWYKLDTPYYLLFWFGLDDVPAERVAERLAYAIESTEPRRVAGFGKPLSYKPLGVMYPTQAAYTEVLSSGTERPSTAGIVLAGIAQPQFGGTVQFFLLDYRTPEAALATMQGSLTHELTHMYQTDNAVNGPVWWTEGQAEWFSFDAGAYDDRLFNLAKLQDLQTLSVPLGFSVAAADGRGRLAYDVGVSFVNWLVATYGFDAVTQINELQGQAIPFYQSIEQVTGQTFLEVENGWRTYIGWEPFAPEDLDPSLALEPYEDSMLAVGDTVTLPATPMMVKMYEDPGPGTLPGPQCFANTPVEILQMGVLEDVAYFKIDCMGLQGWVTRDVLVGP